MEIIANKIIYLNQLDNPVEQIELIQRKTNSTKKNKNYLILVLVVFRSVYTDNTDNNCVYTMYIMQYTLYVCSTYMNILH